MNDQNINPEQADTPKKGRPGKSQPVETEHLISVCKDGETIGIHPLALDNHIQIGWALA